MTSSTSQTKRVLLIGSSLSPEIGTSAFRVFQFANLLQDVGWKPIVFFSTPLDKNFDQDIKDIENKGAELFDLSPYSNRINQFPDKNKLLSLFSTLKRRLIGSFIIPDISRGLWLSIRQTALELAQMQSPALIISCSPAASTHLLAEHLSQTLQIPWIADMGDCSFDRKIRKNSLFSNLTTRAWIKAERSIYSHAKLILHRNPTHHRLAKKIFQEHRHKCKMLEDGVIPVTDEVQLPELFNKLNPGSFRITAAIDESVIDAFSHAFGRILKGDYRIALNVIATSPVITKAIKTRLGNYFSFFFINEHYQHAVSELHNTDLFICSEGSGGRRNISQNRVLRQILAFNKSTIVLNPSFSSRILVKKYPHTLPLDATRLAELFTILEKRINYPLDLDAVIQRPPVQPPTWQETITRLSMLMEKVIQPERILSQ